MNIDEKKILVDKINQLTTLTVNQSLLVQSLINVLKSTKTIDENQVIEEFSKVQKNYMEEIQKQSTKIIVPEKELTIVEPKFEVVGNTNVSGNTTP